MADASALAQLLDMGIPRGRAQAALKRSKGDIMAAAERVFAGEFDDIDSDNEGDDERRAPAATGLQTPDGSASEPGPISQRVQDVVIVDSDDDDEPEDFGGDFEMDDFVEDDDNPRMQDPYAGIFFSKDRVERIVEAQPEEEYADVVTGGTYGKNVHVKILSRGEWMSGCPEGGEQSFLFQLYNLLTEGNMPCSNGCGYAFPRSPADFFALFPTFPDYTAHLASIIQKRCPQCNGKTCFACGDAISSSSPNKNNGKGKALPKGEIESLFHCSNAQGVIIGVGLQMIEQAFHPQPSLLTAASPSFPPPKKRKIKGIMAKFLPAHGGSVGDSEASDSESDVPVPYFRKNSAAKGTGYSGAINEDRSGQHAAEAAQAATDAKTAKLLSQVCVYLPTLRRDKTHTSDYMVHPTALAHLRRRSGFVNDLLRNDSLIDMSNRNAIYIALLDWLEVVSNHEALAPMLAMPQMRPTKVEAGPDNDTLYVTYDGSPSPREMFETIVIQATAALKGLSSTAVVDKDTVVSPETTATANPTSPSPPASDTEQNSALQRFCERILTAQQTIDRQLVDTKGRDFVERMRASLPKIYQTDSSEKVTAADSEEATKTIYEQWANKVRFQYCDLHNPADADQVTYRHAYDAEIRRLVGIDAPRRSLAIAKELGTLTTNLPIAWNSSIFLRVDEARVDCIKAMIIGPKDTPYENGCFIFDIFLPLDYNQRCPNVKSMTTNGGKFRYNPNLYADGKVCLSLLGTWSGPGWIAGKSTLLQVLISIQSLILCEEPYLNEPGWADQSGSKQSKAYSANVRRMVIVDAIGNNLKDPPFPFENEIKTHFRLKANAIRAQLDRWKAIDDSHSIDTGGHLPSAATVPAGSTATSSRFTFDGAANEVRRLLDELAPVSVAPAAAPAAARRNPARFGRAAKNGTK